MSMTEVHTQKKRVLIIEDEEGARKPLSLRLNKLGFDVASATDGVSGLEEVKRQIPDLIILDLYLPKMSGEEVCKAIREDNDDGIANIPIIMLTAKDGVVDKIVGKVVGANAYITKPCDFEDLVKEIKRLRLLD